MASLTGSRDNGSMVQVDEEPVRGHLDEVVRKSVEETLKCLGLVEALGEFLALVFEWSMFSTARYSWYS